MSGIENARGNTAQGWAVFSRDGNGISGTQRKWKLLLGGVMNNTSPQPYHGRYPGGNYLKRVFATKNGVS